jgi:hypothetical protein
MEPYPHASPSSSTPTPSAPVGPVVIKVSLDEAVVIDRRTHAELMTDGLSGCVAVALKSGDRIGLTHIYSDALGRFDDYRAPLAAFARDVANGGEITEAYLVHNNNQRQSGHARNLPEMIRDHLVEQGVARGKITELPDNGCTIANDGLYFKHRDNPAIFASGGHTNSRLEHLDPRLADAIVPLKRDDLFRFTETLLKSGYGGPSELADAPVMPAAHAPGALDRPALTAKAPPDHTKLGLDDSVRVQLGTLEIFKFSEVRPAMREIAAAAREHGFATATITASADKQHIFATGGDGTVLTFDVASGKVKPAAATGPIAASSTLPSPSPASSSTTVAEPRPGSLYEQAREALSPHSALLRLSTPGQLAEAAREIASQAHNGGLTGITRIEAASPDGGKPSLIAHQDDGSPKQAPPVAIETLQRAAGTALPSVASPSQAQDGPHKGHM